MAEEKSFGVIRNTQSVPITGFDGEGNQYTIGPHDRLVIPHDRPEILWSLYSVVSGSANYQKLGLETEDDRSSLADNFVKNDQSQQNEF